MDLRDALLAATSALDAHLKKSGLLTHVDVPGEKRSKTGGMHCPARKGELDSGDTSDPVLDCGGVVVSTGSFSYLGSIPHRGLSDHYGVGARTKKASQACGALRDQTFRS